MRRDAPRFLARTILLLSASRWLTRSRSPRSRTRRWRPPRAPMSLWSRHPCRRPLMCAPCRASLRRSASLTLLASPLAPPRARPSSIVRSSSSTAASRCSRPLALSLARVRALHAPHLMRHHTGPWFFCTFFCATLASTSAVLCHTLATSHHHHLRRPARHRTTSHFDDPL